MYSYGKHFEKRIKYRLFRARSGHWLFHVCTVLYMFKYKHSADDFLGPIFPTIYTVEVKLYK